MQIFVKTLTGKTITLDVECNETINSECQRLRFRIEREFSTEQQRFVTCWL